MLRLYSTLFILFFIPSFIFSQTASEKINKTNTLDQDSIKVKKHPPNRAMLFSLILPGAGQVYNRKIWKVPLVYAAMGTTLYFAKENNKLYKEYHNAYLNKTDGKDSTLDAYPDYSESQIYEIENYHRRYRDLNIILTALFYTLNGVDAYVDAHMMNFNVSDDLSLHILPSLNISAINKKPKAGFTLALTFWPLFRFNSYIRL